jgi:kinesin family protein 11
VWQYVDQWELTQSRDTVLKAWRQRSGLNANDDAFTKENLPPKAEDTDDEDEGPEEAMIVDTIVSSLDQHQSAGPDIFAAELPVAVSLASSASSTSIPIPQPPSKHKMSGTKSGLPILGTLTDRPTNVITYGASRRVR